MRLSIKQPFFHIIIAFLCVVAVYYDNESYFAPYDVWRVLVTLLAASFLLQYIFSRFLSVSASALTASIFILGIAFPYECALCQKLLLAVTPLAFFIFYKFKLKLSEGLVFSGNLFTTTFLALLVWKIGSVEYDPKAIRDLIQDVSNDRVIAGDNNFNFKTWPYHAELNLENMADNIQLKNRPNIYHFVLDAYASDNVLRDIYGYDNSYFSNELENIGFYVSKNAHNTYNQTIYSMASIFNKSNVTEASWYSDLKEINNRQEVLGYFVGFGKVHMELKNNGYRFARSINEYVNIKYPPIYSTYKTPKTPTILNTFDYEFLKRKFYWDMLNTLLSGIVSTEAEKNRMFIETSMSDPIPNSQPPFFYYQHNISPHPIFNVSADGRFIKKPKQFKSVDKYKEGYINKLKLTNTLILKKIKRIMESDNHSKILIIHGDHGGDPMENSLKSSCLYDRYSPYFAIYYDGRIDIEKYFTDFSLPEMYPRIFQIINNRPLETNGLSPHYFVNYVDKSIPPTKIDDIGSLDNCLLSASPTPLESSVDNK